MRKDLALEWAVERACRLRPFFGFVGVMAEDASDYSLASVGRT